MLYNFSKVSRRNKLFWFQVIGCIIFLLQPVLLPVRPDDMERFAFSREISKNILANALILLFFYLNYFVLIPRFYRSKKYLTYFLLVLACFSTVLLVSNTFSLKVHPVEYDRPFSPPPKFRDFPPPPDINNIPPEFHESPIARVRFFFTENDQIFFLFGSIVLFSLLLNVSSQFYKSENAKQKAEINYLLAQINPHFLFNALNSIYTLTIKENAQDSSSGLLKLSGLLRYVFTETSHNSISLGKEITYISDFIELQKLRLTKNVKLSYVVNGNLSGKEIAPMLLIPLIENAFKHGVSTDEDSEIDIQIDVIEISLKLFVKNKKVSIGNDTIEKSGLGIANVKHRLQLLYPGKHYMETIDQENMFITILQIYF